MRRAAGHDQRKGIIGPVFAVAAVIGGHAVHVLARSSSPGSVAERSRPAELARGAARLLPAVPGPLRRGGQRAAARRRRPSARAQGARARRPARPLAHDVARAAAPLRRQRDHLRRAPRAAPLRRPARGRAARRARAPPRRRARRRSSSATAPRSCCASAAAALLEPGDELVTPWPSLSALSAAWRAARTATRCRSRASARDALLRAVNDRTRIVVVCNPNDPTGELMRARRARRAARRAARARRHAPRRGARRLRRRACRDDASLAPARAPPAAARLPHVLEGLGPRRPALRLRDRRARGRAAARAARARPRRQRPRPGAARSRRCARRSARVRERASRRCARSATRVVEALRDTPVEVAPSQANVLWMRAAGRRRRRARRAPRAPRRDRRSPAARSARPSTSARACTCPQHAERLLRALELADRVRTRRSGGRRALPSRPLALVARCRGAAGRAADGAEGARRPSSAAAPSPAGALPVDGRAVARLRRLAHRARPRPHRRPLRRGPARRRRCALYVGARTRRRGRLRYDGIAVARGRRRHAPRLPLARGRRPGERRRDHPARRAGRGASPPVALAGPATRRATPAAATATVIGWGVTRTDLRDAPLARGLRCGALRMLAGPLVRARLRRRRRLPRAA